MRIFILLNKDQDDYSSLSPESKRIFVFDRMGGPTPDAVDTAIEKLTLMFDAAMNDDKIIFNGPSWLIAIAGYVWMSDDRRSKLNILAYDNFKKQYVELNNAY